MARYRLTLAYDGTDFAGWQLQTRAGSGPTVQGVLEDALARLSSGSRVAVEGAGRTDAGVHAEGQVASFTLPREMARGDLHRALNALLPPALRVLDVEPCALDFHARKSALGKLYRYVLDTGAVQLPTRRRTAAHVRWRLDEDGVRAVAALFLGRHDFAALASSGSSVKTTVRTVERSEARFVATASDAPPGLGPTLVYEVEADGFLRKMVRSMVGGMVEVGRGGRALGQLRDALESRDRRSWPPPAEARGLTLVGVTYPVHERPQG